MEAILDVINLSRNFGGLCALSNVSFSVKSGEVLGLIGPNGSGKTTLFNVITGIYHPSGGEVFFKGERIDGLEIHKIAGKGLCRTFQGTEIYRNLTVLENIKSPGYCKMKTGLLGVLIRTESRKKQEEGLDDKALEILKFIGLYESRDLLAGNLPYGSQRLLGIGIGLFTEPELLLLDEPATGMNPEETQICTSLMGKIRNKGVTIIVVEHDMKVIMNLCDRIVVINSGLKIAEGRPEEIKKNKKVIDVYLGSEDAYS